MTNTNDTNKILLHLSEMQREAVTYVKGPELILAGAGSGKTRVLTHKVAWLISEGIASPESILAVTFTNKAAGEMRTRIDKLLDSPDDAKRVCVSTFHGYGLRFLFRYRESAQDILKLREGFTVFDTDNSRSLMKEVINDLFPEEEKDPAKVLEVISRDYVLWSPSKGSQTNRFDGDPFYPAVADEYRRRLRENNAVDFDDLMILPLEVMQKKPSITKHEQERIRWLFVDEYQDVNTAQALLLRDYLVGKGCIINVVGDPDQAIYGWRGANINMILNFVADFPNAKTIKLEQNYRSTKMILDASNSLIKHNYKRLKKTLFTAKKTGDKIYTMTAADDRQEADFLAMEISRLCTASKYSYGEIAILYRQNSLSRLIEKTFLSENIPYRIVRGVSFYDRMEIKDVLSIMRLALNPADTVSFERASKIHSMIDGMGAKTRAKWNEWITLASAEPEFFGQPKAPAQLWADVAAGVWKVKGKAGESIKTFAAHMCKILELADYGIGEVVDYVLNDMGYTGHLLSYDREKYYDRLANVKELKSIVPGGNLSEALAEAALFTDADTQKENTDAVSLMTLHAAKGLEFPVVFMVAMENDIFPRIPQGLSPDQAEDELEEERRLCYVGMTRAEEKLYMTAALSRFMYGTLVQHELSDFLEEIPDELKRIDNGYTFMRSAPAKDKGKSYGNSGYGRYRFR